MVCVAVRKYHKILNIWYGTLAFIGLIPKPQPITVYHDCRLLRYPKENAILYMRQKI